MPDDRTPPESNLATAEKWRRRVARGDGVRFDFHRPARGRATRPTAWAGRWSVAGNVGPGAGPAPQAQPAEQHIVSTTQRR